MLNTTTNLIDKYFGLVYEIESLKDVESYDKYHLNSFFITDCPSELANQLREKISQSIQSRNKLEAKLDEVASELYDKKNIPLLKNSQNDMGILIKELEDSPQFSEEAGGMIDHPHLSRNENALAIFNEHFSKLIS